MSEEPAPNGDETQQKLPWTLITAVGPRKAMLSQQGVAETIQQITERGWIQINDGIILFAAGCMALVPGEPQPKPMIAKPTIGIARP